MAVEARARARPECDTWLSLAGDYATIFAKIFSLFCALHQMLTKCRCRQRRRRRLRQRCRRWRWRWRRCLCTLFTFIEAQINKFNAPTGKKEARAKQEYEAADAADEGRRKKTIFGRRRKKKRIFGCFLTDTCGSRNPLLLCPILARQSSCLLLA